MGFLEGTGLTTRWSKHQFRANSDVGKGPAITEAEAPAILTAALVPSALMPAVFESGYCRGLDMESWNIQKFHQSVVCGSR